MMIQRFMTAFAGLFALTAFSACALAQDEGSTTFVPAIDPTAPDAVVEYGGPEDVVVQTANGPVSFTVELAETSDARSRGLMFRESMDENAGMLFNFEQSRTVSIWMENTLIPLDILYIREDGTIVKIITGAVPGSRRQLWSDVPVLSVLELNSGRAEQAGIRPGDVVSHRWFGTESAPEEIDSADVEPEAGAEGSDVEPQDG